MRLLFGLVIIGMTFFSCNNGDKTPDVSNIKVPLSTERFEKELFTLDTTHFTTGLYQLIAKYPGFGENYLTTILGTDPKWSNDSIASYVKGFVTSYKSMYDTSQQLFKDFTPYENEIRQGLQFVKHYFPAYKIPSKIITYIGPVDGYGDIVSDEALVVGLHLHLGKNYSLYKSELVQQTYPEYMSNRFEPSTIASNTLKNIVDDIYPEKLEDKTLVQQMIEKGKRLYVLSKVLPHTAASQLIGYTPVQLKDCYANEQKIWDLFVQNNLLQIP